MFVKSKIAWINGAVADNGGQFLKMGLEDGTVAQCWDKKLWADLYFAFEAEQLVLVDLNKSQSQDKKIYTHVVGVRKT